MKFPPRWKRHKLVDVCDLITDGTHYSPANGEVGEYLYVTSKNVRPGKIDLTGVTRVSADIHREIYRQCPVRKGDVLYVKDGVNAGTAALNSLDEEFSMLSSVALIRPKPLLLDPAYLVHWLNSEESYREMMRGRSGSAITRVILRQINNSEVPLPPLAEQKRIAAILDAGGALREKRRHAIAKLEELVQSIFLELLGDPIRNPRKLCVGTIEDVVGDPKRDVRCGPFGTQLKVHELVPEGVPLIGIENVHDDRFEASCTKFLTQHKAKELRAFDVQAGDVLVTRMGTIGRACVVPAGIGEARISYHLFRLRPDKEKCLPEFLAASIARSGTFQSQLRAQAHGAIMAGLSTSDLRSVKFLIPPMQLQREYLAKIDAISMVNGGVVQAESTLSALVGTLEQRAFSGGL